MSNILICVPIFNEEESLELCLNTLTYEKENNLNDNITILCVNDGSTDLSYKILDRYKNQILIAQSKFNHGLSEVFNSCMYHGKLLDVDYLIIFDSDNQYPAKDIKQLITNIKKNETDIHIGSRDFKKIKHFSNLKKTLQIIGSKFIGYIIGVKIFDATSGFRIYSRKSIEFLFSTNSFTYTLETLLQSRTYNLEISQSHLSDSYETRDSRLFKNNWEYLKKSFFVILKSIFLYKNTILIKISFLSIIPGLILLSRFFIPYFQNGFNDGNIQSLLLGTFYIVIVFILHLIIYMFTSNYQTKYLLLKSGYSPKHNY